MFSCERGVSICGYRGSSRRMTSSPDIVGIDAAMGVDDVDGRRILFRLFPIPLGTYLQTFTYFSTFSERPCALEEGGEGPLPLHGSGRSILMP